MISPCLSPPAVVFFFIQHNQLSLLVISAMHAGLCTNITNPHEHKQILHGYNATLIPIVQEQRYELPSVYLILFLLFFLLLPLSRKAHLIRWWLPIVIFFHKRHYLTQRISEQIVCRCGTEKGVCVGPVYQWIQVFAGCGLTR